MNSRFNFKASTAVQAPAAPVTETGAEQSGGLPAFSQSTYEEYAAEYRERFPEETKALSDPELYQLVSETEDDMSDDEWRAYFLQASGEEPANEEDASDGEAHAARAIALAAKASPEMGAAIEKVMVAKEDWQGGPIAVLFTLKAAYGEELLSFPVPDSEGKDTNNPDKFKVPVTNSKGKTVMRPTTFYVKFSDNTPAGKEICQKIDWLERSIDANASKHGIPDAILEMDTKKQETLLNKLVGRRGTIRASYKKAMKLGFKMMEVNNVSGVVADFVYETDEAGNELETVENTTTPIIVYVPVEKGPVKKYSYFSLGTFNKLNPTAATLKGGGYANLMKTLARANTSSADGAKTGENEPAIKTVDTFVQRFVDGFRFMDEMQSDADPKNLGKLYKLLKHKDGAELVVSFVEFQAYLEDVISECKLNELYAEIVKNRKELTNSKAPVKTAA